MDECVRFKGESSLQFLTSQMTAWKRIVKMRTGIEQGTQLFNKKQFDKAQSYLNNLSSELNQISFDSGGKVELGRGLDHLKSRQEDRTSACTMGHEKFDEMLLEGASIPSSEWDKGVPCFDIRKRTKGGLLPGEVTVLMGPSNSGKSSAVISIIKANMEMGKKVLFVVCEMTSDQILDKLYMNITGRTMKELSSHSMGVPGADQVKKEIIAADDIMLKNLTYIHHVKPGQMYAEDVIDRVLIAQQEMRTRNYNERQALRKKITELGKMTDEIEQKLMKQDEENRGYDLVVVDYPGKLQSRNMIGKKVGTHDEQHNVYNQFVVTAEAEKFHAVLPVQTNREGFKTANEEGGENRMLTQSDIANSFGIATVAANFITINRSPEDKAKGIIRFYIDKSRTNATGGTFISKTDLGRSRTHDVRLECLVLGIGHSATSEEVDRQLGVCAPVSQSNSRSDVPQAKSSIQIEAFKQASEIVPE